MNGYNLSRAWFDFSFDNPEKISPNHSAIYFFAIEHCNRLGWRDKFGFPTQMAMDAIGIKKHATYIRYFNDLVDWGFFQLIQKSTNQYSSNIICLSNALPIKGKALGKAIAIHAAKQTRSMGQSNGQSNSTVYKPLNQKPLNQEPITNENPSEFSEGNKSLIPENVMDLPRNLLAEDLPREQEKGKEKVAEKEKQIPELEEFLSYAESWMLENKKDYSGKRVQIISKYQTWVESGWKDGNNNLIKNWKTKFQNTEPFLKSDGKNYNNAGKTAREPQPGQGFGRL